MQVRGYTRDEELIEIKPEDCPIIIDDKTLALVGREYSPLVFYDTLLYYDEETGIGEGDIVLDDNNNEIGFIFYNKGFHVQNFSSEYQRYSMTEHIEMRVKAGTITTAKYLNSNRDRVCPKFVYDNTVLSYNSFISEYKGRIVLEYKTSYVYPHELKLFTGINIAGRFLTFGMTYNASKVIFHNNTVCLKHMDNIQVLS